MSCCYFKYLHLSPAPSNAHHTLVSVSRHTKHGDRAASASSSTNWRWTLEVGIACRAAFVIDRNRTRAQQQPAPAYFALQGDVPRNGVTLLLVAAEKTRWTLMLSRM